MKANYKKKGYSMETANYYIDKNKPMFSLSTELETQQSFNDGKPTGEIVAYKAWFTQEGIPPFVVKFDTEINLPKYLSTIEFEDLTACEVRYNVYFKAMNIKEIK
jgi:hypothetical protein